MLNTRLLYSLMEGIGRLVSNLPTLIADPFCNFVDMITVKVIVWCEKIPGKKYPPSFPYGYHLPVLQHIRINNCSYSTQLMRCYAACR
jgi:Co/Zn/Cd efflux system component